MFSRNPAIRSICSSRRLRLRSIRTTEQPLTLLIPFSCQRRGVSAVALQIDKDVDESRYSDDNEIDKDEDKLVSPLPRRGGETLKDSGRQRNQRISRRWRPHPSADLGVDVLGRPAEVLILPTRKRKIARLVPSEESDGNRTDLQGSLNSELEPISMQDVRNNIESLKDELGQDRTKFTAAEWKEHKKRLADGFTKTQLEEYLSAASLCETATEQKVSLSARGNAKREIANQIMLRVWRWGPLDKNTVASTMTQDTSSKPVVKDVQVDVAKLEYIMAHEKQGLGRLSEMLGIQIDVFKTKKIIRLTGMEEALETANLEVQQLANNIFARTVAIPEPLQSPLEDSRKSISVFAMLMRKHKLYIAKKGNLLTVVGSSKSSADMVLRDLILMSGIFIKTVPSSLFAEHEDQEVAEVPFHSEDLASSPLHDKSWIRYMSTSPTNETSDSETLRVSRRLKSFIEKLLVQQRPGHPETSQYIIEPGSLFHEYTTTLGQALFPRRNAENTSDTLLTGNLATGSSAVVLRQALLPQILANGDFVPIGPKHDPNAAVPAQPLLLNIRLQPSKSGARYPPLELLLSGKDASLGHRQKLTVRQAFAIIDQWQHNVLIPSKSLDIIMNRYSKIDLLGDADPSRPKRYISILRQLGVTLEQARTSDRHQLPLTWKVDLSALLRQSTTNSNPNRTSDNAEAPASGARGSDDSGQGVVRQRTSTKIPAMYILESAETLDFNSYSTQQGSDHFFVDHVICHTESNERPRQRQILRISDDPLDNIVHTQKRGRGRDVSERHKWLKNSTTMAYRIAAKLHNAENSATKSVETHHSAGSVA